MARPVRIDPEHGIHHVYTRGTKRWIIFHDDVDRRRFMGTLSKICERYGIEVLAYCLMDNHLHIVLRCPDGGLSAAMRDLKSTYARWFNFRHSSSGPIFEDRFGSKLVTSERQLRQLVRYVHRNPLAINPAMNLGHYQWSSHAIYLGTRGAPTWFNKQRALPLFESYQADVETPIDSDAVQNPSPSTVQVSGTWTVEEADFSAESILIAVARAGDCDVGDVHPSRRNGLISIALLLASDLAGLTVHQVFEPFGYRTYAAAARATKRARQRLNDDIKMQTIFQDAQSALIPMAA